MKKTTAILAALALLSACAHPNQNRYAARDVGLTADIEFGTVAAVRTVEITGENSGAGAAVGMTAGAVGGSFIGSGDGSIAGLLAGAIIGAVAGAAAEHPGGGRHRDTGRRGHVVQGDGRPCWMGHACSSRPARGRVAPDSDGAVPAYPAVPVGSGCDELAAVSVRPCRSALGATSSRRHRPSRVGTPECDVPDPSGAPAPVTQSAPWTANRPAPRPAGP